MFQVRDDIREHRIDWAQVFKSFFSKKELGSSSHHSDEKKQVMKKKRKVKKQFKKSEEIDAAERKLRLDEDAEIDEEDKLGKRY